MKNQNENKNNEKQTNETKTGRGQSGREQGESKPRLVLPLMKTPEDAMELCRIEQDNFYMSGFMIQCWLGHAGLSVTAEYAEKKEPRTRALQTGQTWRAFIETMGPAFVVGSSRCDARTVQRTVPTNKSEADVPREADVRRETDVPCDVRPEDLDKEKLCHFLAAIFRFTEYEDPCAVTLREAVGGYLIENGPLSEADHTKQVIENPVPVLLRLCDWFDAVFHLQNHIMWHRSPVNYDPDPDKRELATLGIVQRNLSIATPVEKAHWHWHYGEAAERFGDSPKLRVVADALSSDVTRVWQYPDVDTSIISVWPLLKRHNWTYADLLKTIRPKLKRPEAYPCDREQAFATYCTNVLGLRKTGKGKSCKGEPVGADVARRLLGIG